MSWATTMSGYYRLRSPLRDDQALMFLEAERSQMANLCGSRPSDIKLIPVCDLFQREELVLEKAP
jgi:hypothetical protein